MMQDAEIALREAARLQEEEDAIRRKWEQLMADYDLLAHEHELTDAKLAVCTSVVVIDGESYSIQPQVAALLQAVSEERDDLRIEFQQNDAPRDAALSQNGEGQNAE